MKMLKSLALLLGLVLVATELLRAHTGHDTALVAPPLESAVTGNGIHTYKTVPGWGAMDDGAALGPTHGGVAVSSSGDVYVSTDGDRAICVFDSEGVYLRSIAPDCIGTHSLLIREEGGKEVLYGAHLKGPRIVKLGLDGEVLLSIEETEAAPIPGGLKGVTAVAVGGDGRIYAGIGYGSNFVHVFSPEGTLLQSFGSKGKGADQFRACHGMAIDLRFDAPRLLIADRENRRLTHYDLEGELIGVYAENLRRPCAMSFFGEYCAVAELEGRVTILNKQGVAVAFLGDNPSRDQWADNRIPLESISIGLFGSPHGLCFDAKGNLLVQDWNLSGRITKLDRLYSE